MKLTEGLQELDLKDLVLPLISIDEYESKLDNDAIVVAFFVTDKDPANDLNRFIQKSSVNLLDCDTSPAPNEQGYYLVFVEFLRDKGFVDKLQNVLETLKGLTDIDMPQWRFKPYGYDQVFPVEDKQLTVMVRLEPDEDEEDELLDLEGDEDFQDVDTQEDDDVEESFDLTDFFRDTLMDDLQVQGNNLVMERLRRVVEARVIAFGPPDTVMESLELTDKPLRLDEAARSGSKQLTFMLGESWNVMALDGYFVVGIFNNPNVAVLAL